MEFIVTEKKLKEIIAFSLLQSIMATLMEKIPDVEQITEEVKKSLLKGH